MERTSQSLQHTVDARPADPKFLRDLAGLGALGDEFLHLAGMTLSGLLAASIAAFALCFRNAFLLALEHDFALELCYGAKQVQEQFSHRCRGVDVGIEDAKRDALCR